MSRMRNFKGSGLVVGRTVEMGAWECLLMGTFSFWGDEMYGKQMVVIVAYPCEYTKLLNH